MTRCVSGTGSAGPSAEAGARAPTLPWSNPLFVGDARQNLWEEVSIVDKGNNYGWNAKEKTHCFSTETPSDHCAVSVPTIVAGWYTQ